MTIPPPRFRPGLYSGGHTMDGRDQDERERLRIEAKNLERRSEEEREDDPTYADHLQRRADHCRRLARDEE